MKWVFDCMSGWQFWYSKLNREIFNAEGTPDVYMRICHPPLAQVLVSSLRFGFLLA